MPCSENTSFENQVLNAFIAYDNLSAGKRAMQLVCELERETPKHLQPLLWRFDVLADPDWQHFAVADVIRAELLIISTARHKLPTSFKSWLTTSLSAETRADRALVALLGRSRQTVEASLPTLISLQTLAKSAGLAFFAPWPLRGARLRSNRKIAQSAEGPLEMGQPDNGYRYWGINE